MNGCCVFLVHLTAGSSRSSRWPEHYWSRRKSLTPFRLSSAVPGQLGTARRSRGNDRTRRELPEGSGAGGRPPRPRPAPRWATAGAFRYCHGEYVPIIVVLHRVPAVPCMPGRELESCPPQSPDLLPTVSRQHDGTQLRRESAASDTPGAFPFRHRTFLDGI